MFQIHSSGNERTRRNKRVLFLRERPYHDTSLRVNPVTCRVIRRSMMQCGDGLQPLWYCLTAQHKRLLNLKREQLMDSLTDVSIDRFGQLIS